MRPTLIRLAALVAGVVLIASCDTTLPTATRPSATAVAAAGTGKSKPTITVDSPLVGALINIGDSILVTVQLHDSKALTSMSMVGLKETGSIDLGTFQPTPRYKEIDLPSATGTFRPGLRDTTVRRYLQPNTPIDTTVDSLVIVVIAKDSAGGADTVTTRVNLVAGPKVFVVSPTNGDSIPAGVGLNVAARATHPNGVGRIDIRVQGEANWPTKLDTSFSQVYTDSPRDATFSTVARVPIDAPIRGKLTITASSVDVDRQPGASAPIAIFVRSANRRAAARRADGASEE